MRALALVIATVLVSGCAQWSAGPVIVHSPSLGFESPYLGATVRVDLDKGNILSRVEGSYYNAQKIQTGDGYGLSGSALAGAKFGSFLALGGYRWNQVVTSAYDKDSSQWLAEAGYHFRSGGIVSGTYSLETDGSGWDSYGLRCEVPWKRVRLVSTWEHLNFATLAGEPTSGDRVTLAALWRFGSGG